MAVALEHHDGVLGALAVADLRGLGGEPVRVAAELRHAGLEGVAGAGRFLEEEHVERLGAQNLVVVDAGRHVALEAKRHVEQEGLPLRWRGKTVGKADSRHRAPPGGSVGGPQGLQGVFRGKLLAGLHAPGPPAARQGGP